MYAELYRFLILHKELSIPNIGTFSLIKRAAAGDFPNRKIEPPSYTFSFQTATNLPSKKFYNWLSNALLVSDREAIVRFNDFAFDLKRKIGEGETINWNGIGTLGKELGGDIKFVAITKDLIFEQPVKAEKLIREKAEHMVRVGEAEKTSAEMEILLTKSRKSRSNWWAYAIIIALLVIMFLGWYFSDHGLNVNATGNGQKLVPQKAISDQ
jgi:hypothetical protein